MDPPPAVGVRRDWLEVPALVRGALEDWAGSRVTRAISQASGFSPGVAARLRFDDGRRLFVKAVGAEPNADSPDFHRREARVVSALPDHVPVPRLRWWLDDAETGWVVLVFDEVDGDHPAQPWRLDELDRVLDGLHGLSSALTPSPLGRDIVPTAAYAVSRGLNGWQKLLDEPRPDLDDWSRRHMQQLADLEAQAPSAVEGDTLLNFDVRADNVLLSTDHVWFVDWPHARTGAAWADVVFFAPSVTMQGGPLPEQIIQRSMEIQGVDPHGITAAIATISGFFTYQSLQPPPPGIPTVRAFQAAQGRVACEWLAQRTGWS